MYGTKVGKFKQGVLLPAANATVQDGPKLLSGVADKLPDGIADALGGFLGGKK